MAPKKAAAQPTRASTRTKASPAEPAKPAANTKAKITKKETATKAAAPAKGRAATKATTTTTKKAAPAKTNGEVKKPRGRPAKKETSEEPAPKAKTAAKRKRTETPEAPAAKKAKVAQVKVPKVPKKGEIINEAPTQKLHVYVFGEGSSGELGLGTAKNAIDVKRPRLNANLEAAGVVQIACGGMHVLALTHDNKILSWGVNDQGAVGRDTNWDGGLIDMDDNKSESSDDSDDDTGMNPKESTPTAIPSDKFPEGTVFVQVAAGDSCSFALTDDGNVWGWGTFRSNEGILGFTAEIETQREPMLIPHLKKIQHISCGANHVLALSKDGAVYAWGSGQQNQLGRRVVERTRLQGLTPREFGLPRKAIKYVACGSYHSFAIDNKDRVWAWGLNNYGEAGIPEGSGEDAAIVAKPEEVTSLSGRGITCLHGGGHHSIAVTGEGDCLVWGRIDANAMGIPITEIPEDSIIKDEHDKPRILKDPTKVSAIQEPVAFATAGSEHCIAITRDGQAYSWGFSANYQTGLATTDDVTVATKIENTAVKGKKLNFAGAGGQYSLLTSPFEAAEQKKEEPEKEKEQLTNGVNGETH